MRRMRDFFQGLEREQGGRKTRSFFQKNPFRISTWGRLQERRNRQKTSRLQGWDWLKNRDFFKWSFQFPWGSPDDKDGVLQDVHWSWGYIGHFTSYAMGNIIASQWWHRMAQDIPNQDELMARGDITPIRQWLVENVHQHGKKYLPTELIQRVTGGHIDTGPYLEYLQSKYRTLYHL